MDDLGGDRDPLIVGFRPISGGDGTRLHSRLASGLDASPLGVARDWRGDSESYFVITEGASLGQLYEIAAAADAQVSGIARLIVDAGAPAEPGAVEDILIPSPGVDLSLPAPDAFVDAEKLVCPTCGGIGYHFSPPH